MGRTPGGEEQRLRPLWPLHQGLNLRDRRSTLRIAHRFRGRIWVCVCVFERAARGLDGLQISWEAQYFLYFVAGLVGWLGVCWWLSVWLVLLVRLLVGLVVCLAGLVVWLFGWLVGWLVRCFFVSFAASFSPSPAANSLVAATNAENSFQWQ